MKRWIRIILFCSVMIVPFLGSSQSQTGSQPLIERYSTHSDSLLIMKDNEVLFDLNPDSGPIEAMSITKSIVSLGIGILVDEGSISIDQPIGDWFLEFKEKEKEKITIRHLLSHTSGLQAQESAQEIYQSDDFVKFAIDAKVLTEPGKVFFYNNRAINILSGIIEKVSGKRMDCFIKEKLFDPLEIKDFSWEVDKAGQASGHSGLKIKAKDLAKIGQLIVQEGIWNGKKIISKEWLALSMEPGINPSCGLLWWRWDHLTYAAMGYLGQYLVIIPESKIVGVRQVNTKHLDSQENFKDFLELLLDFSKDESSTSRI